jgi:hypothetical protein
MKTPKEADRLEDLPDLCGVPATGGNEALEMILLFGVAGKLLCRPNRNYHQISVN